MKFEAYPFEKLSILLKDITPDSDFEPINLTIGEPQFQTPQFIQDELKNSTHLLSKYPKSAGEEYLKEAQREFVKHSFNIELKEDELIPTFGTRELLFNFPQFLLFDKPKKKIAYPNPFYQIYEGAAIASRAESVLMELTKENSFKPKISEEILKEVSLVILNFPNNPTGSVMELDELCEWVVLALKYDFVLLNDECYSEIYTKNRPHSLLEAALKVGNSEFKNILVANSISKRSSAPGLRSGFIAGDAKILREYQKYRTYLGCAIPLPLQVASAAAWRDTKHAIEIRQKYAKNLYLAKEILEIEVSEATFYLWLYVKDDLAFTKEAYRELNLKVLPGSFLGRNSGGKGYIRVALVENELKTKEALNRLKIKLDKIK